MTFLTNLLLIINLKINYFIKKFNSLKKEFLLKIKKIINVNILFYIFTNKFLYKYLIYIIFNKYIIIFTKNIKKLLNFFINSKIFKIYIFYILFSFILVYFQISYIYLLLLIYNYIYKFLILTFINIIYFYYKYIFLELFYHLIIDVFLMYIQIIIIIMHDSVFFIKNDIFFITNFYDSTLLEFRFMSLKNFLIKRIPEHFNIFKNRYNNLSFNSRNLNYMQLSRINSTDCYLLNFKKNLNIPYLLKNEGDLWKRYRVLNEYNIFLNVKDLNLNYKSYIPYDFNNVSTESMAMSLKDLSLKYKYTHYMDTHMQYKIPGIIKDHKDSEELSEGHLIVPKLHTQKTSLIKHLFNTSHYFSKEYRYDRIYALGLSLGYKVDYIKEKSYLNKFINRYIDWNSAPEHVHDTSFVDTENRTFYLLNQIGFKKYFLGVTPGIHKRKFNVLFFRYRVKTLAAPFSYSTERRWERRINYLINAHCRYKTHQDTFLNYINSRSKSVSSVHSYLANFKDNKIRSENVISNRFFLFNKDFEILNFNPYDLEFALKLEGIKSENLMKTPANFQQQKNLVLPNYVYNTNIKEDRQTSTLPPRYNAVNFVSSKYPLASKIRTRYYSYAQHDFLFGTGDYYGINHISNMMQKPSVYSNYRDFFYKIDQYKEKPSDLFNYNKFNQTKHLDIENAFTLWPGVKKFIAVGFDTKTMTYRNDYILANPLNSEFSFEYNNTINNFKLDLTNYGKILSKDNIDYKLFKNLEFLTYLKINNNYIIGTTQNIYLNRGDLRIYILRKWLNFKKYFVNRKREIYDQLDNYEFDFEDVPKLRKKKYDRFTVYDYNLVNTFGYNEDFTSEIRLVKFFNLYIKPKHFDHIRYNFFEKPDSLNIYNIIKFIVHDRFMLSILYCSYVFSYIYIKIKKYNKYYYEDDTDYTHTTRGYFYLYNYIQRHLILAIYVTFYIQHGRLFFLEESHFYSGIDSDWKFILTIPWILQYWKYDLYYHYWQTQYKYMYGGGKQSAAYNLTRQFPLALYLYVSFFNDFGLNFFENLIFLGFLYFAIFHCSQRFNVLIYHFIFINFFTIFTYIFHSKYVYKEELFISKYIRKIFNVYKPKIFRRKKKYLIFTKANHHHNRFILLAYLPYYKLNYLQTIKNKLLNSFFFKIYFLIINFLYWFIIFILIFSLFVLCIKFILNFILFLFFIFAYFNIISINTIYKLFPFLEHFNFIFAGKYYYYFKLKNNLSEFYIKFAHNLYYPKRFILYNWQLYQAKDNHRFSDWKNYDPKKSQTVGRYNPYDVNFGIKNYLIIKTYMSNNLNKLPKILYSNFVDYRAFISLFNHYIYTYSHQYDRVYYKYLIKTHLHRKSIESYISVIDRKLRINSYKYQIFEPKFKINECLLKNTYKIKSFSYYGFLHRTSLISHIFNLYIFSDFLNKHYGYKFGIKAVQNNNINLKEKIINFYFKQFNLSNSHEIYITKQKLLLDSVFYKKATKFTVNVPVLKLLNTSDIRPRRIFDPEDLNPHRYYVRYSMKQKSKLFQFLNKTFIFDKNIGHFSSFLKKKNISVLTQEEIDNGETPVITMELLGYVKWLKNYIYPYIRSNFVISEDFYSLRSLKSYYSMLNKYDFSKIRLKDRKYFQSIFHYSHNLGSPSNTFYSTELYLKTNYYRFFNIYHLIKHMSIFTKHFNQKIYISIYDMNTPLLKSYNCHLNNHMNYFRKKNIYSNFFVKLPEVSNMFNSMIYTQIKYFKHIGNIDFSNYNLLFIYKHILNKSNLALKRFDSLYINQIIPVFLNNYYNKNIIFNNYTNKYNKHVQNDNLFYGIFEILIEKNILRNKFINYKAYSLLNFLDEKDVLNIYKLNYTSVISSKLKYLNNDKSSYFFLYNFKELYNYFLKNKIVDKTFVNFDPIYSKIPHRSKSPYIKKYLLSIAFEIINKDLIKNNQDIKNFSYIFQTEQEARYSLIFLFSRYQNNLGYNWDLNELDDSRLLKNIVINNHISNINLDDENKTLQENLKIFNYLNVLNKNSIFIYIYKTLINRNGISFYGYIDRHYFRRYPYTFDINLTLPKNSFYILSRIFEIKSNNYKDIRFLGTVFPIRSHREKKIKSIMMKDFFNRHKTFWVNNDKKKLFRTNYKTSYLLYNSLNDFFKQSENLYLNNKKDKKIISYKFLKFNINFKYYLRYYFLKFKYSNIEILKFISNSNLNFFFYYDINQDFLNFTKKSIYYIKNNIIDFDLNDSFKYKIHLKKFNYDPLYLTLNLKKCRTDHSMVNFYYTNRFTFYNTTFYKFHSSYFAATGFFYKDFNIYYMTSTYLKNRYRFYKSDWLFENNFTMNKFSNILNLLKFDYNFIDQYNNTFYKNNNNKL